MIEPGILPPTQALRLESLGVDLAVWSGVVDSVVPFHAVGELASEVRPLDVDAVTLDVTVRYQACNGVTGLLPRTERLSLRVPLDMPTLSLHTGHGQREAAYDSTPHMRRLIWRKVHAHPLGFLRFIAKSIRLELAARRRRG